MSLFLFILRKKRLVFKYIAKELFAKIEYRI